MNNVGNYGGVSATQLMEYAEKIAIARQKKENPPAPEKNFIKIIAEFVKDFVNSDDNKNTFIEEG